MLGHYEKILHRDREKNMAAIRGGERLERKGAERKQISEAFLGWLYHRTVIELDASVELLSCVMEKGGRKPTVCKVVESTVDQLRNAFHDKWYRDHKLTPSDEIGHGIFEMYDGQWGVVRSTCAVDWKSVIDIGGNRIRRCCPNFPAYGSAFCSSCEENLMTTKQPTEVNPAARMNYLNELQQMKYLKQNQFFIEAVVGFRENDKRREYNIKWVGFEKPTWEPRNLIPKNIVTLLDLKASAKMSIKLDSTEIWDEFFTDEDSSIFDTKAAKSAFLCCTNKDVEHQVLKKRNRVAAICIGVSATGVVESVYESFRSESLSQLWLHRLDLVNRYPELNHTKTVTGYDDGCHWWAYVSNPSRSHVSKAAKILSEQDVIIDNAHLRGHKDPRCKEKFNPKKHPIAKHLNTQCAEQTFSWFHLFKHICRNMNRERYWIFMLGMLHERNKITIRRRAARRSRISKRKQTTSSANSVATMKQESRCAAPVPPLMGHRKKRRLD